MYLPEQLIRLQKQLNAPDNLPRHALRRNSRDYPIVSTINNITACLLSDNLTAVSALVDRAVGMIEDVEVNSGNSAYLSLAQQYIEQIQRDVLLVPDSAMID